MRGEIGTNPVMRRRALGARGGNANGVVSHAGGGFLFAPNSLAGLTWAASSGCERVEVDVQRTGDGAFVLIHDYTVELPQGAVPVGAVSLAELTAAMPADAPPLLLEDACTLLAHRSVDVVFDLKRDRAGGDNALLIAAALEAVARHGLAGRSAFHSDSIALLTDLLALEPGAVTGAGVGHPDRPFDEAALRAEIRELARLGILEAQFYGSDPAYASVEAMLPLIADARACGLVPGVWTVNDLPALEDWLASPMRFVVTDLPDEALARVATERVVGAE